MPLGLPLSSYGLMQNPEPFVWGRGGGRRSLDDISLERRLAQQQMLSGADYSPVQHWTQGLARVGNGLAGGLRMRSADREAEEARTAQQQIIAELIGGGGENPDASIAAALADPDMRDVALNVLESRQTKPEDVPDVITLARIANDPTRPEWEREAARMRVQVMNDPQAVIPLPGGAGTYIGPQSGVAGAFGQAGPSPAGGPPAVLPPDFDFEEGGGGASRVTSNFLDGI